MYHNLWKGDAVLSLILFHRLVPQSADLTLQFSHLFPLLVAHVLWYLESMDVDMFQYLTNSV